MYSDPCFCRIHQSQAVLKRFDSGVTDAYTTTFEDFDTYGFSRRSVGSNSFSTNVRTTTRTYLHDLVNGFTKNRG